MAKRNTLKFDTKGLEEYMEKLERVGGDIKNVTVNALEQASKKVEQDTLSALEKSNLPANGKHSKGDTKKAVIKNSKATWEGTRAVIPVGFDYSKHGAGGLLITGTPKMQPDRTLNKMYKGKRYMTQVKDDMKKVFADEIERKMR